MKSARPSTGVIKPTVAKTPGTDVIIEMGEFIHLPPEKPEKKTSYSLRDLGATAFTWGFNIVAASTTAINATLANTGINLKYFSPDKWLALPASTQALSVLSGLCSETVNVAVGVQYTGETYNTCKNGFLNFKDNFGGFLISNLMGIGGAIAASMLTYESYAWMPTIGVGCLVLFSAYNTFSTRFPCASELGNKVKNYFDLNLHIQKEVANQLSYLKPKHLKMVNKIIAEHAKKLEFEIRQIENEPDFKEQVPEILSKHLITLFRKFDPTWFKTKTKVDHAREWGLSLFDSTLGVLSGAFIFPTFATKGISASHALGKLFGSWHPAATIFIAGLTGIASVPTYTMAGLSIRQVLWDRVTYCVFEENENKAKNIISLSLYTIANAFGSMGPYKIALGVIGNSNPFYLSPRFFSGELYAAMNGFSGGMIVNFRSCLKTFYPICSDYTILTTDANLNKVITFLANTDNNRLILKDADDDFHHEVRASLRQIGLFQPQRLSEDSQTQHLLSSIEEQSFSL